MNCSNNAAVHGLFGVPGLIEKMWYFHLEILLVCKCTYILVCELRERKRQTNKVCEIYYDTSFSVFP